MNTIVFSKYHFSKLLALCGTVLWATGLPAQEEDAPIYELNPFEVSSELDNGYQAKETISGIGIATAMRDLPFTTNVITSDFLEDNLVGNFKRSDGLFILRKTNDPVRNCCAAALVYHSWICHP